jgi:hypothetical protein
MNRLKEKKKEIIQHVIFDSSCTGSNMRIVNGHKNFGCHDDLPPRIHEGVHTVFMCCEKSYETMYEVYTRSSSSVFSS